MDKPPKIEDVKKEKDPVKRAFLAGYWIGYTGSSEWVGRGNELKRLALNWAEHSGKLKEALNAYRTGKDEGRTLREGEILRGLSYRADEWGESIVRVPVVPTGEEQRTKKGRGKMLNRAGVLNIPTVLKKGEMLRSPRFLRRGL